MTDTDDRMQRIAKVIARSGVCSRRAAETLIEEGRVTVEGEKITSPALNVGPEADIRVDGKPIPKIEAARLWRYYKPTGLICTNSDMQGRPTIFQRLPKELPRVISVGRLDLNSEGLLLLTNDGELARRLELPETGWVRRYRVRVHGTVDADKLKTLEKGVTVDGVRYGSIKVEVERQQGSNAWLLVSLAEGKNREIRKVMEHLGYPVNRLIRISYGPFQLGRLSKGEVEEVSPGVLRDQTGRPHKGAKAKPRKPKPGYKAARKARHKDGEQETSSAPPARGKRPPAKRSGSKPVSGGKALSGKSSGAGGKDGRSGSSIRMQEKQSRSEGSSAGKAFRTRLTSGKPSSGAKGRTGR